MAEINQVDILVKADVPAIVDNQQLLVYVPIATENNYGIVKPDGDDLTVENGILKLKEGGSVQQGQLDKKVDKLTDSSDILADDTLKLYAQDNQRQEGYVTGSKNSSENTVAIRTAEGTLKSQRAQTDWDLVPLKQVEEIAQANDTPSAITDATLDANIGQNAITHKSLESWTYDETGKSQYINVERRIPIIAGKGIKFTKDDDLKAISIYTDLEAKLNENIIKDPSKTYLVWQGDSFPNSINSNFLAPAGCTIDWGDGNVQTFETESTTPNEHTYTDGYDYHLIAISGLTSIGDNAFTRCSGLMSITIGNGVTTIGGSVFNKCNSLTSITIPDSVTSIGSSAFYSCPNLKSITIPNSMTHIGASMFAYCTSLTNVTIPNSITTFGNAVFIGCSELKSITLKSTTPPTLGSDAIPTTIEKIIVPKSAISAYKSAAGWLTYANKIVYEIDSSDLDTRISKTEKGQANGVATLDASGKVPASQLPSYVDDVINGYIVGSTPFAADWLSLTAGGAPLTPEEGKIYVIVSEGAYLNNSYRWSGTVYAPVGSPIAVVQQKGQSTEDVMSQKATTDSLNSLEAKLNENIVKDPSKTYLVYKGNQFPTTTDAKFKAPAGSTIDWGDGVVETFETASTNVNTHTYIDGYDYHLIAISGLTSIDKYAFYNCSGLKSVTIGNAVTSLGYEAFQYCTGLKSIVIPNSVTSIDEYVFYNCIGLTSITIPGSVTSIERGMFHRCTGLTNATILGSVTSINSYAFLECYKLISITLKSTTPPTLASNTIPTTIEKIIVPKSAINAYKSATGWSTYADKIVYEVDSSDLPDMSNYVDLNSTQQIIGKKQFAQAEFLGTPNSYSGYKVGNPSASSTTTYENGYIDFKNKDNSHKGSIKIPSVNDDLNTFALLEDIPDTSNLSSFSVEVW